MPTENRSNNADPRDVFIRLSPLGLGEAELRKDSTGFEDQRTHNDYLLFLAGYRESHPATQPHPEPMAWMVGTAFWWTKEEAERDAAATGLPISAVGPIADPGEVERLNLEIEKLRLSLTLNDDALIQDGYVRIENRALRSRLDEQNELLREIKNARDWNGSYSSLAKKIDAAIVHTPPAEYDEP